MSDRRRILDFLFGALAGGGLLGCLLHFGGIDPVRAEDPLSETESGEFLMTTGTAAHGGALLFVLNTRTRVLNVYESEGGSTSTRHITFVASRKIERDLHVTGYYDKSEYSYQDLVKRFQVEETRARALERPDSGPEDER